MGFTRGLLSNIDTGQLVGLYKHQTKAWTVGPLPYDLRSLIGLNSMNPSELLYMGFWEDTLYNFLIDK